MQRKTDQEIEESLEECYGRESELCAERLIKRNHLFNEIERQRKHYKEQKI